MTYRSDHDAALARVASLEAENAVLQRQLKAPSRMYTPAVATPDRRRYWPLAALVPVVGIGAAVLTSGKPHVHASTTAHDKADLERCARTVAAKDKFDEIEVQPKPWGRHPMAKWAAHMPACSNEVRRRLTTAVISDEERGALEQWSTAEDTLSNVVSLITTYYESDPDATDQYASSHQLWREYDRAFDGRQAAITEWQLVVSQ